jgi:hypothetical protein
MSGRVYTAEEILFLILNNIPESAAHLIEGIAL